jgi:hypothetical protein
MRAAADPAFMVDRGGRIHDDAAPEAGLRAHGRVGQDLAAGTKPASAAI